MNRLLLVAGPLLSATGCSPARTAEVIGKLTAIETWDGLCEHTYLEVVTSDYSRVTLTITGTSAAGYWRTKLQKPVRLIAERRVNLGCDDYRITEVSE